MADILVIDDDPGIRRVLARTLTNAGHQIREAEDGSRGLAAFHSHHPECVIIDIVMPEKEGIATILEMRRHDQTLPILSISGAGYRNIYLDFARKLGANASLEKPFRPAELINIIKGLLSSGKGKVICRSLF